MRLGHAQRFPPLPDIQAHAFRTRVVQTQRKNFKTQGMLNTECPGGENAIYRCLGDC
jgi:hypothetical protein